MDYLSSEVAKKITSFLEKNADHYTHFVTGVYVICHTSNSRCITDFYEMMDKEFPSVSFSYNFVKRGICVISITDLWKD